MSRVVILGAVFLLGCALTAMFQTTNTAGCTPVPMPTGEQIYTVEFAVPPPSNVYVGQWVRIEFSGGMLVPATGLQCGEDFTVLFPNLETAEATTREVQVKLNDQVIFTQRCGYDCVLEFPIPIMARGAYEWELAGVWDTRRFPVFVEDLRLT